MTDFTKYGLSVPEILFPKNIDTKTWSVDACDQYTQDKDYWAKAAKIAGDKPSTLNLIFPEVYLNDEGKAERIQKIKKAMASYIDGGVFDAPKKAFVYVERTTAYGRTRKGLVAALDLDTYEWKPFSDALTRATEATILERIPPRMEIRRGAPLELPHIMLLANDPGHLLVEGIGDKIKARGDNPLYQGDLMQESGSIKGWAVASDDDLKAVEESLQKLYQAGSKNGSTFLFAVGDGNHSLATAKEYYERLKAANPGRDLSRHPARYALIELVNLHSSAIRFEAIQRIVMGVDTEKFMKAAEEKLGFGGAPTSQRVISVIKGQERLSYIHNRTSELSVGSLQDFIDGYIAEFGGKVDYIHGADVVKQLSRKDNTVGFILPDMQKSELFRTVIKDGALPRKTFSMGHAADKRFYMECRRIDR